MKSVFAPVAAAFLFAASAVAQLTINTPLSVVVCQPLLISWSGGTPPYFLSILPGNQPTAPALLDFGTQTGTSLTWTVNITAGTSLGLNLRDSTGALAQSAAFTVQASSNTACLTASGSSAPPSTGTTTGGGATTTNVTPVTPTTAPPTTPTTTTKPATATSTKPAGSTTSSATKPSSAATLHNGKAGLAVGVGAALFALLA